MSDWVRKGTCGCCINFEYEGSHSKGYCHYFRCYYWPEDSCRYYEDAGHTSGSGCFLTTACCQHKGLPDDCHELQTMRRFRDEKLMTTDFGKEMIRRYYRDAPGIVEKLNIRPDRDAVYARVYGQICRIVELVEAGKDEQATIAYLLMTYDLMHLTCMQAGEAAEGKGVTV